MKTWILLCCVTLFVCCKKETNNVEPEVAPPIVPVDTVVHRDTAKVSNYFPAYPKSIWDYKDSNGKEIIRKTDSTYTLVPDNIYNAFLRPTYATKYENDVVNGYDLLTSPGHSDPWTRLLPKKIVKGMFVASATRPYNSMASVDVIDTALTVNGINYSSVVIASYYSITGASNGNPIYGVIGKYYFAKDIGIIKRSYIDISTGNVTGEEVLVKYTIGKK
jgi:hypothetical protein